MLWKTGKLEKDVKDDGYTQASGGFSDFEDVYMWPNRSGQHSLLAVCVSSSRLHQGWSLDWPPPWMTAPHTHREDVRTVFLTVLIWTLACFLIPSFCQPVFSSFASSLPPSVSVFPTGNEGLEFSRHVVYTHHENTGALSIWLPQGSRVTTVSFQMTAYKSCIIPKINTSDCRDSFTVMKRSYQKLFFNWSKLILSTDSSCEQSVKTDWN